MRKSRRSVSTSGSSTGIEDTNIEDMGASVEVRRHAGARRLTLRVSRTRRAVIVTIPLQCDLDEAGSFISRNMDWVRERLDNLPDPVPFVHGSAMPLRGEPHAIVFTGSGPSRLVELNGTPAPRPEICVPGSDATAEKRLRGWLFDEATFSPIRALSSRRAAGGDGSPSWLGCWRAGRSASFTVSVCSRPFLITRTGADVPGGLDEMP